MARKGSTPAAAPSRALPSTDPPSQRWRTLAVMAALVAVTLATYTPVWRFAFVALDDPQYVYQNPDLAAGLTAKTVAWAFTTGREANWHPLTWLSHALDVSLFGMNAGGHHAVNLLFHLANTLLLFLVWRRMTGSIGRSAFVAAVFAVHPLHVESVAWVAERKDVLSAFFFMLTLGAYVRYTEAPTWRRYAPVWLCLALGLLAKAMLVTVPMVLLLLDYWPLRRARARPQATFAQRVVEKWPLIALVTASSVVTFLAQRHGGAVKGLESFPLGLRLQNTVVSYVDYLRATVWPAGLGVFYPFPSALSSGNVALSTAILVALTGGAILVVRRVPAVTVGWFWFVGMLVPVIGLVQIGGQARSDRYMYLPIIGLAVAAAWGAVALATTPARRRVVTAAGVVLIAASGVVAHAQVQYWRETVALWKHTADVTEGTSNFGVYFGLAEYLRTTGRAAESIPDYEASIQRNPGYLDARLGLVRALVDTGQPARAIAALHEIVAINPTSAESRMTLGLLLAGEHRAAEAIDQFTEVVRLKPDLPDGQWRLALALVEADRLADALPHFAEAVRLSPAAAPIRNDYGWALVQNRQTALAIAQLREAVRLKPDFVDARHNLGRVLAAEGQTAEALAQLSEAVRLEPTFTAARLSFGLALLRAGRIDDGARELREVLRQDPGNATASRALAAVGR